MTRWATELEILDRFYATTIPVGCPHCGGVDGCRYGCVNWDEQTLVEWEMDYRRSYGDRPATESEAHVEWHLNTGVPMGTPGCPQDACHGPERWECEEEYAEDLVAAS